jgi:hypothetical protein
VPYSLPSTNGQPVYLFHLGTELKTRIKPTFTFLQTFLDSALKIFGVFISVPFMTPKI